MYKYELHAHSREGSACSSTAIGDMIKRYKELGFSGMAITNHFYHGNTCVDRALPWEQFVDEYSRAYFEGQETADRLDFDLLFGIEEGYGGGKEFLAYGFEPEFLRERPFLRNGGIEVWSREIHSVGGFLAYAHPFRDRAYILNPKAMPDMRWADGVEVDNFCNTENDNREAAEVFTGKTTLIVGNDFHGVNFASANAVALFERVNTSAGLAKKLLANDFSVLLGERA